MTNDQTTLDTETELEYLTLWARANGCELALEGNIGFGRPCVGIIHPGDEARRPYVAYDYRDRDVAPPLDVDNAYHKDSCLAVLLTDGDRGTNRESAIHELYLWVRHLNRQGYEVVVEDRSRSEYEAALSPIDVLINGTTRPMLRKKNTEVTA
jgi:hypothetical protein